MAITFNEVDLSPDTQLFFRQLATLPSRHYSSQICNTCRAIRFEVLPFENELGVPHQPSLRALKDSANSCNLCNLILLAVQQVRENVDNDYKGIKTRSQTDYDPDVVLPSGKKAVAASDPGNYSGMTFLSGEFKNQTSNKPGYPFTSDLSVRPWLFGNWWKGTSPNAPLQLLGLGVRLAKTPNVEDAEGNGQEVQGLRGYSFLKLNFHGSYLQVKAGDGT
jgi:hypothetical protein